MDPRQLFPLFKTVIAASLLLAVCTHAIGSESEKAAAERLSAIIGGASAPQVAEGYSERGSWAVPAVTTAGQLHARLQILRDELGKLQGEDLTLSVIERLDAHAQQIDALQILMSARFEDVRKRLAAQTSASDAQQRLLAVSNAQAEFVEGLLPLIREPVTQWHDGAHEGWLPVRSWYQWQSARSLDSALVSLEAHLKQKPVSILRASSLPLRSAGLAPRPPITTPVIEPAYSRRDGGPVLPQAVDLASTVDAPLNEEILRKARELEHDYIKIYEFVRNEIATQWYAGGMKGALGTLRQGSGNDVDQASLLLALFRASGLPARYVHGVVELTAEQIASTLALPATADISQALTRAGVAFEPVIQGGRVALFRVEHTWITAHVPYTNYRGAVVDASGKTWLPLMPAVKRGDNGPSAGLLRALQWSVDGMLARHMEEPQAFSPLQEIRAAAFDYLAAQGLDEPSYQTMLGSQSVQREELGLLPSTVPVKVVAVTAEAAELAGKMRQRLRLIVRTGDRALDETVLDQTVAVSTVASERFTLSYMPASIEDHKTTNLFGGLDHVPPYLIKLRPQVKINGKLHAVGTGFLDHASPHYFEVRLLTPSGEQRISQTLTAGSYHAIGVAAQSVAEHVLQDDPSDTEHTAAALLNRIAQSYNHAWNQADAEFAGLLNVSVVRPFPSINIVSNVHRVHEVLGQPHAMEWQGVSLDAAFRVAEPIDRGDAKSARDWMRLSGLHGSNLEARIFEEHFSVNAISADKAIGLASQAGIPLLSVDKANLEAVLPGLDHPSAVLDEVRRWVARGFNIRLPQTQLDYEAWNGSAWRVEDPISGSAGYFIAGGLAGGQTAQNAEFWTLGWLADALRSPNSAEPNPDPLAAASIAKFYYSDGQTGEAGTLLGQPIAVLVRDIDGRPVAQAPVTFVSVAGGGDFGIDGQTTVKVLTDELGVAKTDFRLGRRTDANSVWVMRNPGDVHATLAGSNVVEASVESGLYGQLPTSEPFNAIGYPGAAVSLLSTTTGSRGSAGSGASSILSEVKDQYGNNISNASVTFVGNQGPPSLCAPIPDNAVVRAHLFDNLVTASGGYADCPSAPMLGDCGSTSKTVLTSSRGASVGVILGNVPQTSYPVTVSSAGTASETLDFAALGACAPGPSIHVTRSFIEPKSSAVKVQNYHPSPYKVTVRYDVREPEFDAGGNVSWRPGATYLRTTGKVVSTLTGGGHADAHVYMGAGNYHSKLKAGPEVGPYSVSDHVSGVAYPELEPVLKEILKHSTPDNNAERVVADVRAHFLQGVQTGAIPVLNAIDPAIVELRAQGVADGQDPGVLTLDAEGRSLNYADINYRLSPATFSARSVEIDLFKDGVWQKYWVGSSPKGDGTALINRGIAFDAESTNQLQLVVNRGQYEVRGDLFDVPIKQRLFQRVKRSVRLSTDVDIANQRICSLASSFKFTISEEAKISLSLVNSQGGQFENRILDNQLFSRGEHVIPITTAEVRPGRYDFKLEGTTTRTGETETETGMLVYEHTSRDNLPLGHTLVKGVNVHTGALVLNSEDLRIPGRGAPLLLQRSYSSASSEVPGPLGLGWSHNYDSRIILTPCGDVIISGGDGSGLRFVDDGNGGLRPLKGHHGTLIADHGARTFDFYSKDGTRYHYRQMGVNGQWFLEFIQDTNGNLTKLGYDPNSLWDDPRVSVVQDGAGRTLKFTYDRRYISRVRDNKSLLTSVRGPDGMRIDYEYDDDGSLVRAAREGDARIDEYDYHTYNYQSDPDANLRDARKLVAHRNGLNGSQSDYAYHQEDAYWQVQDDQGVVFFTPRELVSQVTTPDGTTGFVFSTTERKTEVSNERGHVTAYRMNQYGSVVEMATPVAVTTTEWDLERVAMRSQTTLMSAGLSRIEYDYDEHGNKIQERVTDGIASRTRQWAYVPQANFTPPYIKNRPGSYTDRNGHKTAYEYDAKGNLIQLAAPHDVSTSHTYAANGDRLRTIDPNGNTTRYQYDAYGYPERVIDALGGNTHYKHDERGRQTRFTDARGNSIHFEYDTLGRETQKRDEQGGTTTVVYEDASNRRSETDPEQRTTLYQHDWSGRLLTITNPLGNQKVYEYDAAGNQTLESNWHGNSTSRHDTTFSYDEGNRLERRRDPLGRLIEYDHDAVGNLLSETLSGTGLEQPQVTTYTYDLLSRRTSQTRATESTWLYEYDGEGNKTAEVDAEGRRSEFEYDALNRLIEQREPLRTTLKTYDPNGNLLTETLVNGAVEQTRTFEYDALNRRTKVTDAQGQSSVLDYDAVGNLVSEVNARLHRTTYAYDALNRRTRQELPPNIVSEYRYDKVGNVIEEQQPNGNIVETLYDALNRPLRSSDSLGLLSEVEYDANGNRILERNARDLVTLSTYNALNQLTEQQFPGGDSLSFSYDVAGNVVSSTDARGHTTRKEYDAQNRLIKVTDPAPFNYTQTYSYDKVGNQLTETDRRGNITSHQYDQRNRVILTTSPAPFNFTQRYEYDAADNLTAEVDRRGTRTQHTYDRANRRLSTTKAGVLLERNQYDAVGNVDVHRDANDNRTSYVYNERNLLISESRSLAAISQFQYDAMGNRTQRRDPEGRITRWTYDARNRSLSEERDGAGTPLITAYEYDGNGNRTLQRRPLGNAWTYTYDQRDRLLEVSDPDGNTTAYSYDANGNHLSQTNARGHTTSHDYDALNRQTATQYPDSVSEFQDYDANGNRTLLIDAKGQTFGYHYDALNRLTQADYPVTGLAGELTSITYQYDANNNAESISEQRQGQSERVTLNRYDAFDRLEAVIDGYGKEQRYSYDANGNRISLRDPDGVITRYTFDALNRIASVNNPGGATAYSYDRSSRKTRVSYPNGSRADYRYDNLGRLEQLSNTQHGATVSQFSYRYDANGNRVQQTETNGQGEELTTYVYDDLDRLTEVSYPDQTVSYAYDTAYNRTSERTERQGVLTGDKTLSYDNRNRLTSITDHHATSQSVSFGYDANGNQISKTENSITTQFVYDARDKLVSLTHNGSSLGEYGYDYQGMRIEKIGSDASVVRYSYDGQSVLTQFDEAGDTLAKYDYGPDQLLSLAHRDQGRQFYLFDALGSIANLTRTDGSIQARYQYDAWGNLRQQSGDSWNSFGFTGHERDKESGLYYFKARYYDPKTARFLTQDSYLGEADTPPSLHRYLYAYGNPTIYIDPDGHAPVLEGIRDGLRDWSARTVGVAANMENNGLNVFPAAGLGLGAGLLEVLAFGVAITNSGADLAIDAFASSDNESFFVQESRRSLSETRAAVSQTIEIVVENPRGVATAVVSSVAQTGRGFIDGDNQAVAQVFQTTFDAVAGAKGGAQSVRVTKEAIEASVNQFSTLARRAEGMVSDAVMNMGRASPAAPRPLLGAEGIADITQKALAGAGNRHAAFQLISDGKVPGLQINSIGRPVDSRTKQFVSYAAAQKQASRPDGVARVIDARDADRAAAARLEAGHRTTMRNERSNMREEVSGRVEEVLRTLSKGLEDL